MPTEYLASPRGRRRPENSREILCRCNVRLYFPPLKAGDVVCCVLCHRRYRKPSNDSVIVEPVLPEEPGVDG